MLVGRRVPLSGQSKTVMQINVHTLRSVVFATFCIAGLNARAANQYSIIIPPESIIVEAGTFGALSAQVTQKASATFNWEYQKGTNAWVSLGIATNHLHFAAPTTDNVGGYRVTVSWAGTTNTITSDVAYLSVYELKHTNSTIGTLTTSAMAFTAPPTTSGTYNCPAYTSTTDRFDRSYNPTNSAGVLYYFYGRYVAVSNQPGPFVNSGLNRFLRIDTQGSFNIPTRTGVRLINGWDPQPTPPPPPTPGPCTECGCEAGDSVSLPIITFYEIPDTSNPLQARYRPTIYYKWPPPSTTGNIVFNWMYFN